MTVERPVFTLRSEDGFDCVNFRVEGPDLVAVQWVELDDGDCESGPICRSHDALMTREKARSEWRAALEFGYTRD